MKPRLPVFASSIQTLLDFLDENPKSRKNELVERFLGLDSEKRTEEQEESVRQLARDFRWLVREGYVTEFADGTLLLPSVAPSPSTSSGKAKKKQKTAKLEKSETNDEVLTETTETSSSIQQDDIEEKPPENSDS